MHPDDYDRWIAPARARMVNCVWRIVRNTADTDDVIQDVLILVLDRFDALRRHPNPTALLLRISAQKALDHLRRRKSRDHAIDRLGADAAALPAAPVSPRQHLDAGENHAQLLAFIARLPAREAEAITLHALEQLDYPSIAQAMDCREATVRVLVSRARDRFRAAFPAPHRGLV